MAKGKFYPRRFKTVVLDVPPDAENGAVWSYVRHALIGRRCITIKPIDPRTIDVIWNSPTHHETHRLVYNGERPLSFFDANPEFE